MSESIPIKNIYYLLCYAWDRLDEGETIDVSAIDSNELADLFAAVLLNGLNHIMRRGLEQGYQTHEAELASIRGKVVAATSARRMLLQHGKAHCEFDEFTVDTQANKIIKATLKRLSRVDNLNPKLKSRAFHALRELPEITDILLSRQSFRKVQLHSNNRYYRFLLNICQLIVDNILIDESSGKYKFKNIIRDEKRMARLFESFVFNFIKREMPEFKVRKEKITWDATAVDKEDLAYLPNMETDISVRSESKTLIVDTKYYRETFSSYYDSESIHSANMYQLFAYLKNIEPRGGPDAYAAGMLLYPMTSKSASLEYQIQGHNIRIQTIDLSKSWNLIHIDLEEIFNDALL